MGFDQGFAGAVGAGGEQCGDVVGYLGEGGWVGSGGCGVEGGGEFVSATGELAAGGAELGEAVADELFVHGAVFERGEVAVDLGVGVGDLGVDGVEFGVLGVESGVVLALCCGHGVGDARVVVAVEGC
ncbi:hypothetical protein [Nocardia terpenica]|uniref:hypothetical protein n=1 Tax=Nocardia terpenica TaxID=455432 RepID=UPI001E292FCD|nr:hypothetical protein [Nocardia terpenica]